MTKSSLSYEDGGSVGTLPDNLWNWLVNDFDLQAPAIVSLRQPASRLESLCRHPSARDEISTKSQSDADHLQWSYGQLKTAALRVAAFLSSHIRQQQRSGDRQTVIVTFVYNSVEWAIFLWAAIALGVPFSPLDPGYLDQPDEFRYYMECLDPSIILVEDATAARKINDLGSHAYLKVMCESESSKDLLDWYRLGGLPGNTEIPDAASLRGSKSQNSSMVRGAKDESNLDSLPDDTAIVLFSSGTSGRPKGCPHTAYSFALQVEGYFKMKPCKWSPSMKNITVSSCFRPICWLGCLVTWRSGGQLIFVAPQFDAAATIRAIASQKGTHTKLVPPQAIALMEDPTLEELQPSTLEFVSIGGNIIGDDLLQDFQKAYAVDRVDSLWGMSEGAGVIGWDREDEEVPSNLHGLAAVGRVLPGVKVRICDPQSEDHKTVSRGVIGDFHISSPLNIRRYLFNRNADDFYTDEQGSWFITGDHAKMDESGIIYVEGRAKDSINRNGKILVPGNIEACLDRLDGIESQVVGIPDAEQGEVPVAIVKQWPDRHQKVTKSTLEDAVVNEVGDEAALVDVFSLQDLQMTDWPYNTTAKILKKDLTDAVVRLKEGRTESSN